MTNDIHNVIDETLLEGRLDELEKVLTFINMLNFNSILPTGPTKEQQEVLRRVYDYVLERKGRLLVEAGQYPCYKPCLECGHGLTKHDGVTCSVGTCDCRQHVAPPGVHCG